MAKIEYTPGQRIQKMVFIGETTSAKDRKGLFICTCGNLFTAWIHSVKSNVTKSCGCYRKAYMIDKKTTHGLSRHPLYNVYNNMIERCYTQTNNSYPNYGGNGVYVCSEWRKDFNAFYDWAIENGWQKELQLDKDIKGDGTEYAPDKCIFVTPSDNCNNRKSSRYITVAGETKTLANWCKQYGISSSTVHQRIKQLKWSEEKAVITPLQIKK